MRLLLASPLTGAVSGVEYVTWATIEALKGTWDVVHLDTATARRNVDRGLPTPRGLVRMAQLTSQMVRLCRQHPDLTIIQCARNRLGFLKFAILNAVGRRAGIPVVAKLGGDDFDVFYRWVSRPWQAFIRRALREAYVLVEARCLRKQFEGLVPEERVRWAYLGVPERRNVSVARSVREPRRLLFVGHVSQAKGAVDLLDAMELLHVKMPSLRLTMLGEHIRVERSIVHIPDPNGAWRRVKALPDYVSSPGVVQEEKWRHYNRADLFIFPSRSEGLPVVILEAMMAGLPIVCTPVGALPEILTKANAYFVPTKAPQVLADTIESACRENGRRRFMSQVNHHDAMKNFTLGHYRAHLLRALEGIA